MKQINTELDQNSLSKHCEAAVRGTRTSGKAHFVLEDMRHQHWH